MRRAAAALLSVLMTAGCAARMQIATPAPAETEQAIRARIAAWTEDFNAGRAERLCDLFSRSLAVSFRGAPDRGYDEQCRLLHAAMRPGGRAFRTRAEIHEIIPAGDLAIVRLDWHAELRAAPDKPWMPLREVGMDIFRREADGAWRIVRYIAYEAD
jgi:steroid delta-isomerase